ncbi:PHYTOSULFOKINE 3 PRECURSOR [Hibiscus trionum]|uniref:Phytosulfokine n=1 Tax=Hibiscus trionum TaxID=183268 RepID=A0A9W7HPR2_HIBTR|nr:PHYTOSULFOKINE 3 PRECURSOR [Hibiscus trionum]
MKGNSVGVLSFLVLAFLLLSSLSTSARLLLQINQVEEEVNTNGMIIQADAKEELSDLIGAEECEEKDEECEKRRVIEEAHLDYIYTQNHKP